MQAKMSKEIKKILANPNSREELRKFLTNRSRLNNNCHGVITLSKASIVHERRNVKMARPLMGVKYLVAKELMEERDRVWKELKVWDNDLRNKGDLAYLKDGEHGVRVGTYYISNEIFNSFRNAAIKELELKLAEIDEKFEKI